MLPANCRRQAAPSHWLCSTSPKRAGPGSAATRPEANHPLTVRVQAAVAPFATIRDDVPSAELQQRWRTPAAGALFVTEEAARWLSGIWGAKSGAVEVVSAAEMDNRLERTPGSLGLVAFEQLDPRMKALTVDGVNVLSNAFQASTYPLAVTLSVEGTGSSLLAPLLQGAVQPVTNRDASKLTQLIMTGVTAMSRVTALRMDEKGYDYPARVISDVFSAADITHISNEVPFLDDCVANPTENNLTLCSDTDTRQVRGGGYGYRRPFRQPCQRLWPRGCTSFPTVVSRP